MSSLSLVEEAELFKGLSHTALEKITAFCQEATYPRGDTIYTEGDETQHVYVLNYGLVTLRVDVPGNKEKMMITAIRDRGETFGWSALIAPHIHTATAICLEPTKLLVIDANKLMRLLEEDPQSGFIVMKNVATLIASRLRKTRTGLSSALSPGLITQG